MHHGRRRHRCGGAAATHARHGAVLALPPLNWRYAHRQRVDDRGPQAGHELVGGIDLEERRPRARIAAEAYEAHRGSGARSASGGGTAGAKSLPPLPRGGHEESPAFTAYGTRAA
jgi:hypothetical protein